MTMFCDCGNPEAHRGEHIPKPVTDTPLDLDAIEDIDPYRDPDAATQAIGTLVAALRKAEAEVRDDTGLTRSDRAAWHDLLSRCERAEAQVVAVLALCAEWDEASFVYIRHVRAAVDGTP